MGIVIKGSHIEFDLESGRTVRLRVAHGMIHDPDGAELPRCEVYFGPFQSMRKTVNPTGKAKDYFGANYAARVAKVEIDVFADWKPAGKVTMIRYRRPHGGAPGGKHEGDYFHPFKKKRCTITQCFPIHPELSKAGSFYRLSLGDRCIMDDRGIVFP